MSLHSTLAAHPTPLRVTIDPLPTLIGVAALLVSLGFLARGGRGSLDALRVARATATDPRSLQAGDRRVRVTGRAEIASGAHGRSDDDKEDAETLPAPFSDEQCLCCAYDVSEYRSQGKGRSWVSIDSGEAGFRFASSSTASAFASTLRPPTSRSASMRTSRSRPTRPPRARPPVHGRGGGSRRVGDGVDARPAHHRRRPRAPVPASASSVPATV